MRRLPLFVLLAAGIAGCPMPAPMPDVTQPDVNVADRTDATRTDIVSMPDGTSMPDAMSMPDATMDGGSMPDAMSMPDAASGPSAQINAVRMAAAGAVDLPIDGVLVTYVVPAITGATASNDPAGFTVQADPTGPALFIAVDPATLTPAPAVGDRVSFRVTMTRSVNGGASRWASAVSGFMRMSSSNPVSGLVQNLSMSADIASALGSYEYELISLTGSVTDNGANAGAAFRSFSITTAGIPVADANLKLRMPQDMANMLGVRMGCRFTIGPTPLWRFTAQAQASAWRAADIMLSMCPAVMDAGMEAGVDAAVDAAVDARTDSGVTVDSGVPADAASDASMGDACVPRIVINEVQSRGLDNMGALGATNEFVELYNAGSCAVNLNGWTLRYAPASSASGTGSSFFTGTAAHTLNPGQYAVFRSSTVAAPSAGVLDLGTGTLGLADSGGVALYNNASTAVRIDSVAWEQMGGTAVNAAHPFKEGANPASAPAVGGAVLSARIPNATDTDQNGMDFAARTMATMGLPNM
ncbi:MAG: lamin tail domain-containing protein [Polyangiales bacterium]